MVIAAARGVAPRRYRRDFLVVAAGGVAVVAYQRLVADRPPLAAVATVFGAGAVLALPVAVATTDATGVTAPATGLVAYLRVASTALAYWLWAIGLQRLSLTTTVTVTLLEPAAATMLATTLLAEPLTPTRLLGIVAVLAGVTLAGRPANDERRVARTHEPPAADRHGPATTDRHPQYRGCGAALRRTLRWPHAEDGQLHTERYGLTRCRDGPVTGSAPVGRLRPAAT